MPKTFIRKLRSKGYTEERRVRRLIIQVGPARLHVDDSKMEKYLTGLYDAPAKLVAFRKLRNNGYKDSTLHNLSQALRHIQKHVT